MAQANFAAEIDENQYRLEVLCLAPGESEAFLEQRLAEEASALGLKVPEVEATASLAASIASGIVDVSATSPVLSSGSSVDRYSVFESPFSRDVHPLDHVTTSLSEFALPSDSTRTGSMRSLSIRSLASLPARKMSYSSIDGKFFLGGRQPRSGITTPSGSPDSGREKRKSSLKSAVDRIYFRKRRTPSAVLLPPLSQITVAKGDGGKDRVYVEQKPEAASQRSEQSAENEFTKFEVPFYDQDELQRSVDDSELGRMREIHKLQMSRYLAFQAAILDRLKQRQQAPISDKLTEHKRLEDKKREENAAHAASIEERQLAVEMEQQREFERAKKNSRTRIKYMEGYFNSSIPPTTRPQSFTSSVGLHSSRKLTPQNKAQLAQEYHDHDSMDQLHEAKIKVLRDRQEIKLQEVIKRMDKELEDLIQKHRIELAELEKEHQQEEAALRQALDVKKTRLRHRWNLEEAILRKKLELKHGHPFGPLPPLTFSSLHYETRDSAICVADNARTSGGDENSRTLWESLEP